MKNKIYLVTVLLLLIFAVTVSQADTLDLTFDSLVEIAKVNNLDAEIDQLNIEIAELDYEEALRQVKLNDYAGGTRTSILNRFKIVNVDSENYELDLMKAKYLFEYNLDTLEENMKSAHYDILLLKKEINIAEETLQYKQLVADNAKKQYELGMISYLDYDQLLDDLESQIYRIEELNLEYKNNVLDFELMLGEDLPVEFDFGDEIKLEFEAFDLNDLNFQEALENSWSVFEAKLNNGHKEKIYENVSEYYNETEKENVEAKLNIEVAKFDYRDAIGEFKLEYLTNYNDIELLVEKLRLYQGYYDISKDELAISETKYNLGMISYEELDAKEIEVLEAKYDLDKIIVEYNKIVMVVNDYSMYKIESYR